MKGIQERVYSVEALVQFVKERKVVMLEDLAVQFGIPAKVKIV